MVIAQDWHGNSRHSDGASCMWTHCVCFSRPTQASARSNPCPPPRFIRQHRRRHFLTRYQLSAVPVLLCLGWCSSPAVVKFASGGRQWCSLPRAPHGLPPALPPPPSSHPQPPSSTLKNSVLAPSIPPNHPLCRNQRLALLSRESWMSADCHTTLLTPRGGAQDKASLRISHPGGSCPFYSTTCSPSSRLPLSSAAPQLSHSQCSINRKD